MNGTGIAMFAVLLVLASNVGMLVVGQHQKDVICTNQAHIQEALARAMQIAAPTHRAAGREAVYLEFVQTARELRERKC